MSSSPGDVLHSPWPARVTWLLLPLVAGPALGAALDGTSRAVQLVASIGVWAGWAAVLVATLVPTTVSLTALRVAAPSAVAASSAALVADGQMRKRDERLAGQVELAAPAGDGAPSCAVLGELEQQALAIDQVGWVVHGGVAGQRDANVCAERDVDGQRCGERDGLRRRRPMAVAQRRVTGVVVVRIVTVRDQGVRRIVIVTR